jgi:hypothetical protein
VGIPSLGFFYYCSVKQIELGAQFGEVVKHIEISWLSGVNDIVYITIDKYHNGQMVYQQGRWNGYMNKGTILTGDDITVLAELIVNEKSPVKTGD